MHMATTKQVKRYVYPVQLDELELEALDIIADRMHLRLRRFLRDLRSARRQLEPSSYVLELWPRQLRRKD